MYKLKLFRAGQLNVISCEGRSTPVDFFSYTANY